MELKYNLLGDGTRKLKLIGKLDNVGVSEIETKFAGYCSGVKVHVLVDLSGVDLLTSNGIRLFILNAKSIVKHGGRMVLLNPTRNVQSVLELAGIPATIPMYSNLESAQVVLMAS